GAAPRPRPGPGKAPTGSSGPCRPRRPITASRIRRRWPMPKPTAEDGAVSRDGERSHARTALKLCLVVVGMFGFGFALVPLYDVLCDLTGLGGRTGDQYTYDPATMQRDASRLIK